MPLSAVSRHLQLPALWHPAPGGGAASRTGAGGEGSQVGEESQGSPQWQGVWGWLREAGSKEMSPFHDAKMLEALIYTTGPKPFPRPLSTITCWCLFVSLPIFQATP